MSKYKRHDAPDVGKAMVNLDLKSIPKHAKLVDAKAEPTLTPLQEASAELDARDDGKDIPL